MTRVMQGMALVLIVFGAYAVMVYGEAVRRILRRGASRYRGPNVILCFCVLAGREQRPWRGRVLRGARRSLLAGVLAGFAGMALMAASALIEIL